MRRFLYTITWIFFANLCHATHIVGGEVYYLYMGPAATGTGSTYKISMRLFRDCNVPCGGNTSVACLPDETLVSVYENGNGYAIIAYLSLPLESSQSLSLTDYPSCVSNKPQICYEVKTYSTTVTLDDNDVGYILAYENCCRATTLNVLNNNTYSIQNLPGVTYDCFIPGTNILKTGHNSTAIFNLKKPDLICYNTRFTLDYGATDPDAGDSVSFAFAPAYTSGEDFEGANDGQPAEQPPYTDVSYKTTAGYSGLRPLGANADINPVTGQISGISPASPGLYVISVIVYEWRAGVNIARHRKDFILRVENCDIPEAKLDASYVTCNGYDLTFTNESTSAFINSYYWDFGDTTTLADTSLTPVTNYSYAKAGTYTVTLITNKGKECSDTAYTHANVYPGFIVDFSYQGGCITSPYLFKDATTTAFGNVNTWKWNFGDPATLGDTSDLRNPLPYKYSAAGTAMVQLIASNSKGCIDTITKEVPLVDKPTITLPFRDTLLCNLDKLQLLATTNITANYTWTPATNISNTTIPNPVVTPQTSTTYYLVVDDGNGCISKDSIRVNVTDQVTLSLPPDTTICLTDTVQFQPVTNGLRFTWTPANTIISDTAKNALAVPVSATLYHLNARIGSCKTDGEIMVNTPPYPVANVEKVNPICFGNAVLLKASYTGTNFSWSPVNTLQNANTTTPLAGPPETTTYTFTVRDTATGHCPKPSSDTVTVVILSPIKVFAGNDTNIVAGQTLQLQATGAVNYHWSPASYINKTDVSNPVVVLPSEVVRITYAVKGTTPAGCLDVDSVVVTQYKTLPQIFVPSAFTPDGDGINDIIKPIIAGIKRLENFSIYDRWGVLMYTTSSVGEGWDGIYKGKRQPADTYVFTASAVDYLDRHIVRKGTVVLIR